MKKIILLLSCWSLTYFSSGNPLFAQDFEAEVEEDIGFDEEAPEDQFYPVERPPFEGSAPDNFDSPEQSTEIVEPAPNEPPSDEPGSSRMRRGSPPFQFGNSPRNFQRPSPARPSPRSGGGGFGQPTGNLQFKATGQEQAPSADSLKQKKDNLKSLRNQYQETFEK